MDETCELVYRAALQRPVWGLEQLRDAVDQPAGADARPALMAVAGAINAAVTDDEIIQRIREQTPAGKLPTPAPPGAVAELEAAVGHSMPALLKRIYLEVADGGFGRGGEVLSLTDTTYSFSDSDRLLAEYMGWRGRPNHPASVVPLLAWGCAIWSLVDFSTPDGRMWGWDPNVRCLEHALFPEDFTLADRLCGWLDEREDFPEAPTSVGCPRLLRVRSATWRPASSDTYSTSVLPTHCGCC